MGWVDGDMVAPHPTHLVMADKTIANPCASRVVVGKVRQTACLTRSPYSGWNEWNLPRKSVSDMSDGGNKKSVGSRVTMRLSDREREALEQLAEDQGSDLTSVIRDAITAYLDGAEAATTRRAEQEKQTAALSACMKREADRVIERHEQTTRALITALNEHLSGNKEPS